MKSYRHVHVGEGIGRRYDALHKKKVDALIWTHYVRPLLRETLEKASAQGASRYLDFACGTGRILNVGAQIFDDATGIDISPDMLEVAAQRVASARIICTDVTTSTSPVDSIFDCVTIFRFFLNAEPELRKDVLRWLSSHMAPGAWLVGNVHQNTWSIPGLITLGARILGHRNLNILSRREMTHLLSEAGFEIVEWRGFRVAPSIKGKSPFGDSVQLKSEKIFQKLHMGGFGAEQFFVAKKRN